VAAPFELAPEPPAPAPTLATLAEPWPAVAAPLELAPEPPAPVPTLATLAEPSPAVAVPAVPVLLPAAEEAAREPLPATPSGGASLKARAATLVAASRTTRKRRTLVGAGLALVVALVLFGIGYAIWDRYYADPLRHAVAGHCLAGLPLVQGNEEPEVKGARLVACNDPAAVYLVQGRLDNVTESQASDPQICRGYRHATEIYKEVPPGGVGYVLCLSRVGA
jgi:hypothetical protein